MSRAYRAPQRRRNGESSGRQTLAQPGFAIEPIVEPVMQAAGAALPELDALGQQAVTAPVWRALGRPVGEASFGLCQQAFQLAAVVNHPALRRGPGTQAAAQWAHLEISIGFARRHPLDPSFDTHLALQGRP